VSTRLIGKVLGLRRLRDKRREARAQIACRPPSTDERWRDDPIAFGRDVWGIDAWEAPPDTGRSSQAAVLVDVARYHRVSTRSGHKVGKSLTAGWLAYWWTATRPGGRAIITAPTFTQVKKILWREVRRLGAMARKAGTLDVPEIPRAPDTGINWPDGREIVGISTNTPENLGGFSGAHVLFIIDEASGYPDEFYEALLGNTAGGDEADANAEAKIVKFGNPTQPSGHFYEDFHSRRDAVRCHHISSEDTPNVRAGRVLVAGLATQHYLDELLRECGGDRDHPLFQIRARGNFPTQGANAIIGVALVELAIARPRPSEPFGALELGIDVARFGDDESVIQPRRGFWTDHAIVGSGADTVEVAGKALEYIGKHLRPGEIRAKVKVDVDGVGGGVADILRRSPLVELVEVHALNRSDDQEHYPDKRSQLWFATAKWLAEGGMLQNDPKLVAELVAPTYAFDAKGRQVVESKDRVKARLGRSPDRADALNLSVYSPATDATIIRVPSKWAR